VAARAIAAGDSLDAIRDATIASADGAGPGAVGGAPLLDDVHELEAAFIVALDHDDPRAAVGALLELDSAISGRVRAGEDSPDLDSASAMFRALIVRLGEATAEGGAPRETLDALVAALLEVRETARANRDWETADFIRDRLVAAGVEVRDSAEGSTWVQAGAT